MNPFICIYVSRLQHRSIFIFFSIKITHTLRSKIMRTVIYTFAHTNARNCVKANQTEKKNVTNKQQIINDRQSKSFLFNFNCTEMNQLVFLLSTCVRHFMRTFSKFTAFLFAIDHYMCRSHMVFCYLILIDGSVFVTLLDFCCDFYLFYFFECLAFD